MGFGARIRVRLAGRDLPRARAALGVRERRRARLRHRRVRASSSDAEYDALEPFQWPRPAGVATPPRDCSPTADSSRRSGKAQFVPTPPRAPAYQPSADYPLVLNTGPNSRSMAHDDADGHVAAPHRATTPSRSCSCIRSMRRVSASRSAISPRSRQRDRRASSCVSRSADAVAPGQVFVPMHWGSVFASNARVGAVIAAGRRPDLGTAGAQARAREAAPLRAEVVRLRAVARAARCRGLLVSRTWRAAQATGATSSRARDCRRRGPSGPTALLGPRAGAHRVLRCRGGPLSRRATSRAIACRRACSSPPRSRCRRALGSRRLFADDGSPTRAARDSRRARAEGAHGDAGPSSARASPSDVRRCCARFAATGSCRVEQIGKALARRDELRLVHSGAQGAARRVGDRGRRRAGRTVGKRRKRPRRRAARRANAASKAARPA